MKILNNRKIDEKMRIVKNRLTYEEEKILKEKIYEIFDISDNNEEVFYTLITYFSIDMIYYLSCLTDISYYKIFSYCIYHYLKMNLIEKKNGELKK